jgi:hypothetical protein
MHRQTVQLDSIILITVITRGTAREISSSTNEPANHIFYVFRLMLDFHI